MGRAAEWISRLYSEADIDPLWVKVLKALFKWAFRAFHSKWPTCSDIVNICSYCWICINMFKIVLVARRMQIFSSIGWQGAENELGQASRAFVILEMTR